MTGLVRAWEYAREAMGILRKHPSLLLVALAFGAYNGIDSLGSYFANNHTTWGKKTAQYMQFREKRSPKSRRMTSAKMRSFYISTLPMSIVNPQNAPTLMLDGTLTILGALAAGGNLKNMPATIGKSKVNRGSPFALEVMPLSGLLSGLMTILISGGYMALVWDTLLSGNVHWRKFLGEGKRVFFRFMFFFLLTIILVLPPGLSLLVTGVPQIMWLIVSCGIASILLLLQLTNVIIVAQNAPLVAAMKNSVAAIRRNLSVALPLFIAPGLLEAGIRSVMMKYHVGGTPSYMSHLEPLATAFPIYLLVCCVQAILAVWICTTVFLWYKDMARLHGPDSA